MDFDSNHLILAGVALIMIILIRTLIAASKEINSSDKFPISNNCEENKGDNENSPWVKNRFNPIRHCGFSVFVDYPDGISSENLSFHFV